MVFQKNLRYTKQLTCTVKYRKSKGSDESFMVPKEPKTLNIKISRFKDTLGIKIFAWNALMDFTKARLTQYLYRSVKVEEKALAILKCPALFKQKSFRANN